MTDTVDREIRGIFHLDRGDFVLDVDLTLPIRGITALFGHSGSGKTTCLRAFAGLERPPKGFCQIGNSLWQDESRGIFLPPHARPQGMVFQEASLFPHLSVQQNLYFGHSRAQKLGETPCSPQEAKRIIELLGIQPLLQRKPTQLSGGERQRVAIGRALLTAPRILFMDEPLAALDLKRKQEILPYLETLHRTLDIPMLYVSHAPDEVARLADHLVMLENGRVVASGPLNQVLSRLDLPPAFADDAGIVLSAHVSEHASDGLSKLIFEGGELWVSRCEVACGTEVRCRIHARDVSLALKPIENTSILNSMPAIVEAIGPTNTPGHMMIRLQAGAYPLLARITQRSLEKLALRPGLPIHAQIKAVALLA